ncbi:MAG TPA: hypothetical protein GXZ76_05090 [Clostridiaceae bacterium]|nr:hypothetical protein [Clostridiaceae bacterium]
MNFAKSIRLNFCRINNANSILRSFIFLFLIVCLSAANIGCNKQTQLGRNQQNADFSRIDNSSSTEQKKRYNTVVFTSGTTTEVTTEPSATTIPATSPAETTSPPTTPTTIQPQPTTPDYEIVSKWEMSLIIIRNKNILQGTLAREWESKIECRVEFGKATENNYKMYLTPISIIHDEQVLDSTQIRQGPIEYDATIYNNLLVFELESEFFALRDDYNLGSVKPLRCSMLLEGANNSRTASDRQILKDIDGKGDVIEVNIKMQEIN